MRSALAVLRLEIAQRRAVLGVAAFVGLLPLILPLLPFAGIDRNLERGWLSVGMALVVGGILGPILGAGVVTGDLFARRMGFFLTRPVGGLALWAGKFGAALLLTFAAEALAAAPGRLHGIPHGDEVRLADFFGGTLLLVALGAGAPLVFRSGARWLVFDGIALVAFGPLLAWAATGWWVAGNLYHLDWRGWHSRDDFGTLAAVAACWLATAGAIGMVVGRGLPARAHRFASLAFWTLAVGLAVGGGAAARIVVRADPGDLLAVSRGGSTCAQGQRWVYLSGSVRGTWQRRAGFLIDIETGKFREIRPVAPEPALSDDGTACWQEWRTPDALRLLTGLPRNWTYEGDLRLRSDLVCATAQATWQDEIATALPADIGWADVVVAPGGAWVALWDDRNEMLHFWSLPALTPIRAVQGGHLRFPFVEVTGEGIRGWRRARDGLSYERVTMTPTGLGDGITARIPVAKDEHLIPFTGPLVVVRSEDRARMRLHDGVSGLLVRDLNRPADAPAGLSYRILADGSVGLLVASPVDHDGCRFRVFAPDGADTGERSLPCDVLPSGPAPGLAWVHDFARPCSAVSVVTLATGAVRPLGGCLAPLFSWWGSPPRDTARLLGGPAPHLLSRYDPATGTLTTLLAGRAR